VTWDSFFTAEVGASAALAGLIFVGISINLQRIVALPVVADRALQALLILLGALGVESLLLVPSQSPPQQGVGILGVTVALWAALNWIEWAGWQSSTASHRETHILHSVEIQLPCLFAAVGAGLLLVSNPSAEYWFVPATLVSFLVAIIEAWVITVEIVR
jgi:hypothetical protein